MANILVRQATEGDLETLLRFQQIIVATERPFDSTIKDGPVQYYDIAPMLLSEQIRFVVAETPDQVVGCGYARIEPAEHFLKHSRHAYLGLMYVEPAFRGQSVNLKIVDDLKHWCLARDVREMRLEVYHDNVPAIRAYEKAGFSKLVIEMRMELNSNGVDW
jgi:ribosomal protein S18 acetylase RimI-like enzyme